MWPGTALANLAMSTGCRCSSCSMKLLAPSRLRSDDPEADNPSCVEPHAEPPIHPFTGTFADPMHTAAFESKLFRFMLPMHVVALAALECSMGSVVLKLDSERVAGEAFLLCLLITSIGVLGLGARITVHRWEDQVKAQRYGAFVWTACVLSGCTAECIAYIPALQLASQARVASSMSASPLAAALFALINASHGMEFWHTASVTIFALCKHTFVQLMCGLSPQTSNLVMVAMCAAGHFLQLLARHAFLQSEHLHTSRERLEYDMRRLEYRVYGSSTAQLPAVNRKGESGSAPSKSSTPTASSLLRSVQSAPAVVRRVQFGVGANSESGPSTTRATAAGSSTTHPSTIVGGPSPVFPSNWPTPFHPAFSSSSPAFSLSNPELAQLLRQQAQMQAERLSVEQDDVASDGLSQHGSAPPLSPGTWSSSDPSTATRDRRRMARAIYELRHGISAPASARASHRCPYV